MSIQPSSEVLRRFNVQLIAPLGGRRNQHWLVECRGERLVLRRWWQCAESVDYELRLLENIASLGWPVAPAIGGPAELCGHWWSLAPFLHGNPSAEKDPTTEQRARGRLLAAFHVDLAQLYEFGQRGPWRRCEDILGDQGLDGILSEHERQRPDEVRILRWHLDRARERLTKLDVRTRFDTVIHGDFTSWNLLFKDGRLSGILDFELAHRDHRVADFALSWRGKYDHVIYGYDEVSPLEAEEWELITPAWWASLVEIACECLRDKTWDEGWIISKLLQRSPLMGPDSAALP
ncbi:MAG: phosphotransferase [Chloroflexi bacterium]|nr:phosphotransferase [Chloroflexota bacterium]